MVRFARIREARHALGLPMLALAQAAGHSIGWVYALERGTVVPSRCDAEALSELLGVPVEGLFDQVREPEDPAARGAEASEEVAR